jgi:hypothetical protein
MNSASKAKFSPSRTVARRGFQLGVACFASSLLIACATPPQKIQASYVSDVTYRDYDCDQVADETVRVQRRVDNLHASLKKTASDDAAQMGVGLILFWPALFFLEGGDGPQAQEYARLKGEAEALERVSIQKRCSARLRSTSTSSDAVNSFSKCEAAQSSPSKKAAYLQSLSRSDLARYLQSQSCSVFR